MSEKINPYDWIHEVTDPEIFAGRKDEIASIENEILRLLSDTPISPIISTVGVRRVGKTSLLNKIQNTWRKHNLLATKVFIRDELISQDPWLFWKFIFDQIQEELVQSGICETQSIENPLGFNSGRNNNIEKYIKNRQFDKSYGNYIKGDISAILSTRVLINDLRLLLDCIRTVGYKGILLLIDEAHTLIKSHRITQQIREITRDINLGIVFAGEPNLSILFTDTKEPLYMQGKTIMLENFTDNTDIIECALLPLQEEDRRLMNPMTIDYLAKLSQGKPNQIRLICNNIYDRYKKGDQEDLNITIGVLENIVDSIEAAYAGSGLREQVNKIQRLDSLDLEILYNMTRYSGWTVEDIVNLDESFRGEIRSIKAQERRGKLLQDKRRKFVDEGVMVDDPTHYILEGGEYLYLYIRFWLEIKKYGELLRRLDLRRTPISLFGEKIDKLTNSLCYEIQRTPNLEFSHIITHDIHLGDVVLNIKKRFDILNKVLNEEAVTAEDIKEQLSECFQICELVNKPGKYFLIFLLFRNLEKPRELKCIEMYFHSEEPIIIPTAVLSSIQDQAKEAKISIEVFDAFTVTLPDLENLWKVIGSVSLEDLLSQLSAVQRWYISSIQHHIKGAKRTDTEEEKDAANLKLYEYLELYGKGEIDASEQYISNSITKISKAPELAKLYNDRGYIRYGLKRIGLAKQDLDMAYSLHYGRLPLTLLNLAIIEIDNEQYDTAIDLLNNTLLITYGRVEDSASHLRVRLPDNYLNFPTKYEQRPANVLSSAYVNLAFAIYMTEGMKAAIDVLNEGLSLLPNSRYVKHALARYYLTQKHADLAVPIYRELKEELPYNDYIHHEINLYAKRLILRGKRGNKN